MRPLIKPALLLRGDRIAIVTPCWGGPAVFPDRYDAGLRQLKDLFDFDVVEMQHTRSDPDWLAARPEARAADLMTAFADSSIKGIIASIGGDDAHRLIPHFDLDVVTRNPKMFLGYSDTTVLSLGFLKAGLVSFYGPAIMSGFCGPFPYMVDCLGRVLFSANPTVIAPNRDGWTVEHLPWSEPGNQSLRRALQPSTGPRVLRGSGHVEGHLIGGCADTLERVRGTVWWPSADMWRGGLLFYETSEDAPSPAVVAGWLKRYADEGVLHLIAGLLFARPGGRIDPKSHVDYDRAILGVLDAYGLTSLPVISNLDFGHTDPMCTLPYGVRARLNLSRGTIELLEAAVC